MQGKNLKSLSWMMWRTKSMHSRMLDIGKITGSSNWLPFAERSRTLSPHHQSKVFFSSRLSGSLLCICDSIRFSCHHCRNKRSAQQEPSPPPPAAKKTTQLNRSTFIYSHGCWHLWSFASLFDPSFCKWPPPITHKKWDSTHTDYRFPMSVSVL